LIVIYAGFTVLRKVSKKRPVMKSRDFFLQTTSADFATVRDGSGCTASRGLAVQVMQEATA